MSNGNRFDLEKPWESKFDIEVIAHALSNQCRFNGNCNEFYSVAQHSVLVSFLVPSEIALAGLLHDAAEAFIGDVTTPIKQLLPEFLELEKRVESFLFGRYGLPQELPPEVKTADLVALATEKRDLLSERGSWPILEGVEPDEFTIIPQWPSLAKALFIERFYFLTKKAA